MTQLLQAAARGEEHAAEELLPLVYGELRKLAGARTAQTPPGQTLQATALVHEAYLRLVGEDEIRAALAQFDDLWAALTPKEQVRVLELLIERVEYDGEAGTVSVTFRPSGIRALEGNQQETVA